MPELTPESHLFRVGYALPARKTQAFMVESFITYAKQRSIDFIPIDPQKPLTQQGPFDCIIHKLYDHQWILNLHHFTVDHPNATVIDPPAAVLRLHNRTTMLQPITHLHIPHLNTPHQILVQDSESLNSGEVVKDLIFPVIVKPVLADGTTGAHNMSLVVNLDGLKKLEPPMVVQRFVNHGGVVFKVYVAGDYVECVKRRSLPDFSPEMVEKVTSESGGVMGFSQISSGVIAGDDGWSCDDSGEKVRAPAPEFLDTVAKGVKEAIGLNLFNFDLIRYDESDGYMVVDINYFPGYEKLSSYESVMVDFFLKIKNLQEEKKKTMMEKKEKDEDEDEDDRTQG